MTITADISVAIAFVIFIVLVVWKGTKKMTAGLDQRAETIRKQLDETQNLREEAQAALASYQRQQRDALAEADEIVAQAKVCLLYTSPSPRDGLLSRMPSSA